METPPQNLGGSRPPGLTAMSGNTYQKHETMVGKNSHQKLNHDYSEDGFLLRKAIPAEHKIQSSDLHADN